MQKGEKILALNPGQIKLICEVVEGKGFGFLNNPTVTVSFGEKEKRKTKQNTKKTPHPFFNEHFEYVLDVNNPDLPPLVVTLFEHKLTTKTAIGTAVINLKDEKLSHTKFKESWFDMLDKKTESAGKIKLRLKVEAGSHVVKRKTLASKVESNKKQTKAKGNLPPIFAILREKDEFQLEDFLSQSAPEDVNITLPKTGNTALHEACIDKEENCLSLLLNYEGIQVNIKNEDKNTALHYFCEKWNSPASLQKLFNLFIERGADVNAANSNGETPIFKAIFNNTVRSLLLEYLINNEANVNTVQGQGEGILHYAVRLGRLDLVNLILQADPDLTLRGKEGKTPYELAIMYKNLKISSHLSKVQELFDWLDSNSLNEYKQLLLQQDITIDLLPDMNDNLLQNMGIKSLGARLTFLKACEKLKANLSLKTPPLPQVELPKDELPGVADKRLDGLESELTKLRDGGDFIIGEKEELEYLRLLGTGASGEVYKGLYRGQEVAIKVLKETTAEQEIDEFKKEFEILSSIRNPNVVFFYGAAMQPRLCMVMEFCSRYTFLLTTV
eukprot:TRINITY_DN5340_c1_g1_i2.p1 TRINITY_DN5340_c1_g1~~TRINITY_DN5340_c1_g1_i2.p1  ORF type:complete len:556 (-),score=105.56 TRINITY_DN5340_c1_g1_i2:734-2401(-)